MPAEGTDPVYEYTCEMCHEDPLDPPNLTPQRLLYTGRPPRFEFDAGRVLSRLLPHTPVHFRVRARNPSGPSGWVALEEATEDKGPQTLVARPPPSDWSVIDISDLIKEYARLHGTPADEQFANCHAVWSEHVATLKVVFRFACLQGASPSPHEMTYDSFLALAKAYSLLSKELTKNSLQLIFVRANINRVDDNTSND